MNLYNYIICDLLKKKIIFTTKFTAGQIKVFFFVALLMWKVQKLESVNLNKDCKTTSKKRINSSGVFTCSGKLQKGGRN